jgi:hypothetical protein
MHSGLPPFSLVVIGKSHAVIPCRCIACSAHTPQVSALEISFEVLQACGSSIGEDPSLPAP